MQINQPFGYSEIVPLYKNQKVRLPAPGALPEFCRKVNAVPISYSEFAVACRDYPLAFITTDQSKTFLPVAVLGVTGGENLFLRDGQWDGSVYLPAYMRRYPFCMARITLDSVEQADRLICVEKAFVSEEGERMFDDAGLTSNEFAPYTSTIAPRSPWRSPASGTSRVRTTVSSSLNMAHLGQIP